MFNIVCVQFPKEISDNEYLSKEYSYLTDLTDLKEGDMVVVDTQYGFRVAKISSLFGDESKANKWVVCAVDTEAFTAKLSELKRKQFILRQVKQRVENQSFLTQAKALAGSDPVLQKLLASLDSAIPGSTETNE